MDRFVILRTIGRGTFGVVYKVRRKEDNKIYALKQVDAAPDALNEIRLLASLDHPNIIRFLEAFPFLKNGSRVAKLSIVMDYAGRGDLSKVIRRHKISRIPLKEERIWKYISQISSAVSFLHNHRILHRDLKAANCFVTKNDDIKVGDMNISKVIKKNEFARTKIGTPYYMSPEVWNDIPYNEKSDVWSLGCLIYELAALDVPFKGYSVVDLKKRINMGHRVKIPNRYYKPQLWSLINKMLIVRPDYRSSIQNVHTTALSKTQTNITNTDNNTNNNIDEKIYMLKTIKMTPKINQLTNRMPKSQYYNKKLYTPIKSRLQKENKLPIIVSGGAAAVRAAAGVAAVAAARAQLLHN